MKFEDALKAMRDKKFVKLRLYPDLFIIFHGDLYRCQKINEHECTINIISDDWEIAE